MNKKEWLNPANFADYIQRFNPFGIKVQGKGEAFKTYEECYDYVFDWLLTFSSRGYIDVPLLLSELTECPLTEMQNYVKNDQRRGEISDILLCNFTEVCREDGQTLESLFQYMHSLSGTAINKEMFNNSLKKFWLKIQNKK